jgi:hypothetical protein
MSRKPLVWRFGALLPLLLLSLLVHWSLPLGAVAAEPTIAVPTGLGFAITAAGPAPTAGNATPVLVVAQLNLDQAAQPPARIAPMPLNPAGSALTLAPGFLPAALNCGFPSATMFVCTLTPTGAAWGSGFVVFNIQLTATDGHSVTSGPLVVTIP